MKYDQLKSEFESKNLGGLWEESWNPSAHADMTLTIGEVRFLANLLRKNEGDPELDVTPFFED